MKQIFLVLFLLTLTSCTTTQQAEKSGESAALRLKPAGFSDLPGWQQDRLDGFMQAYLTSCARILKRGASDPFSSDPAWGTYGDWQMPCRDASSVNASDSDQVRNFIEKNFKVVQALAGNEAEGLFTGYYESTLNGSRTRKGPYQYPLLGRPDDLVMVELGDFREELKGQRIAGRVADGKLKPYENRAQIVGGRMPDAQFRPVVWLDDASDAFFVQVQGSGVVHLDDGSLMRVGYAAQNGHPYYAIGRELVKRGIYKKEDVSMETIRSWLLQNPDKADELMNTNPSYVFFAETPDNGKVTGPKGGEGVALSTRRSLAIDRSRMPYGFPVYLSADYRDEQGRKLERLMMAQDTGGAIRGAVRGDVYWGSGDLAEKMAGPMKAKGRYYFLIPKTVR